MQEPSLEGVGLALVTALCWAISPMCFASAGRRVGSFPVLLLRTALASVLLVAMLPVYGRVSGACLAWPSHQQLFWLLVSALTGMAVGDALFYEALVKLGPRRTTQLVVLSPVAAILPGWLWLGEALSVRMLLGVVLVLVGTWYAVFRDGSANDERREPGQVSPGGVLFAIGGAICAGLGAVAGRQAFLVGPPMDPAVATAIRVSGTAVMLWIVPAMTGQVLPTLRCLRDPMATSRLVPGVVVGPFAGMLCYLFALKHLQAGLVSTLTSMSPLFILPMVALRYRVRIGLDVGVAAALAVAGVALIGLR